MALHTRQGQLVADADAALADLEAALQGVAAAQGSRVKLQRAEQDDR